MKIKLDREHLDKVIAKALRKDAEEIKRVTFTHSDDSIYWGKIRDAMILLAKHYDP